MRMLCLIFCLGVLLILLLRSIYYYKLKSDFKKRYGVDYFPKRVKIYRNKSPEEKNTYTLKFPFWTYANQNGLMDKRRNGNQINFPKCDLYLDCFHIVIKNPRLMVYYVNFLRNNSVEIQKNEYEEKKASRIREEKKRDKEMDELNKIIERYKDDPYNFETFCAHLYYLMGIDAECTSCSNDGGYDIVLNFKNGEKGIVECKCYNNKKIGRPYIQKLVGANQIVGAEHLIYITTSDYSEAAIKYAKETDVELINGIQLLDMINKYIKPHNIIVTVNREEWSLCDEDLKEYIPRDIYIKL